MIQTFLLVICFVKLYMDASAITSQLASSVITPQLDLPLCEQVEHLAYHIVMSEKAPHTIVRNNHTKANVSYQVYIARPESSSGRSARPKE